MALVEVKADIPVGSVPVVDEALLEVGWQQWCVLEDVVTKRAWTVGIFSTEAEARERWPAMMELLLAAGVPPGVVPAIRTVDDADWRDSYKIHFKAWTFGRLHWVPVWERETFKLPPGDAVLWLDPGLAFGTGNHETTRLCVERLVTIAEQFGVRSSKFGAGGPSNPKPSVQNPLQKNSELQTPNPELQTPNSELRPRVVDAGCGSGILALSAALLGFRDVSGFDNDPEAIRVSEENAALNGLAGRVTFTVADLSAGLRGEPAGVLLANIQADVLMRHARELVEAVAPGGTLVLSGILASENSQVRTHFEDLAIGWIFNARVMADWSDIVLTRPK